MKKNCKYCNTEFETESTRVTCCSKKCSQDLSNKKRRAKDLEKKETIVCKWCGMNVVRIFGGHINNYHPGKTIEEYRLDFPGYPISTESDRINMSKNSGKHMKEEKYRQMFSEKFKGENNPNHTSKTTEQERKERSPFSKEFYKRKGIDEDEIDNTIHNFAKEALKDRIGATSYEYWLNKANGDEEEAQRLYKERQTTFSKEICINKYGEEEGLRIWKERQEKWSSKWKEKYYNHEFNVGSGESIIANEFCNLIYEQIKDSFQNIKFGKNEKWISNNNLNYAFDFTIEDNKKIIEFNGDFWHCNPSIARYKEDYFHPIKKQTAKELWIYDKTKIEFIENHGYKVLTIWENDYTKNPEEVIKQCLDFILNE